MSRASDRRVSTGRRWCTGTWLALLAVFACGPGDPGASGSVDPSGAHTQYVIDRMLIPTSQSQVEEFALDIDGDPQGRPDNRMGSLLSTVAKLGAGTVDLQKVLDEEVKSGRIVVLADVQATSLQSASGVGVRVYLGDCEGPCTDHLNGSGKFVVSPSSPTDGLVVGSIRGGRLTGGPGKVTVEVSLIEGATLPVEIELVGSHLQIGSITADGIRDGRVGGAITEAELDGVVLPEFVKLINDSIRTSCTQPRTAQDQCGCGQSFGASLVNLFGLASGSPPACAITLSGLKQDPRLAAFLTPDVDLYDCPSATSPLSECEYAPSQDGKPDAISVGAGFSAVRGTFGLR